jgi:hypothetical protein
MTSGLKLDSNYVPFYVMRLNVAQELSSSINYTYIHT